MGVWDSIVEQSKAARKAFSLSDYILSFNSDPGPISFANGTLSGAASMASANQSCSQVTAVGSVGSNAGSVSSGNR